MHKKRISSFIACTTLLSLIGVLFTPFRAPVMAGWQGAGKVYTPSSIAPLQGTIPYTEVIVGANEFRGGGTAQSWNGYNLYWTYDLPFSFPFYEIDYSSISISTNGYICFDTGASCNSVPWTISNADRGPFLAPFGYLMETDLNAGDDIYITENADNVVIRWQAVDYYYYDDTGFTDAVINFEVVLFNDGRIEFNYGDQVYPLYNEYEHALVGVGDGDASNYLASEYNDATDLGNATSMMFYPYQARWSIVNYTAPTDIIEIGTNEKTFDGRRGVFSNSADVLRLQKGRAEYTEYPSADTFVGGGTAQSWQSDDAYWPYTLPFDFPFYGTNYTGLQIGSNGTICVGDSVDCSISGWYPYGAFNTLYGPFISAYGRDIITSSAGQDIYVTELSDEVIIRWDASECCAPTPTMEFEIHLYSDGRIVFVYGPQSAPTEYDTFVGISAGDGIDYVISRYSNNRDFNSVDAVEFRPPVTRQFIADLSVNMTANRDWTGVSADTDQVAGKSVVHGLTSAPGVSVPAALYVPIPSSMVSDAVVICPGAATLAEVTSNCTGRQIKRTGDSGVSQVSMDGVNYWRVEGITGTGGLSAIYRLLPDTGEMIAVYMMLSFGFVTLVVVGGIVTRTKLARKVVE